MQPVQSHIYPPPSPGFPYLAVIFNTEGRVAMAEPFWSCAEAENFIEDLAAGVREGLPSTQSANAVPMPKESASRRAAAARAAVGRGRSSQASRRS